MGVLNVTPDSFSDGGEFVTEQQAIEQGLRLFEEGADIVDVGGESTRPGAEPVDQETELDRVLPVVKALTDAEIPVSIDTMKAGVALAALEAGAQVVNDVSGLRSEGMLDVAVTSKATVCIMHMLGEPRTMQADPQYDDVVETVLRWLLDRAHAAMSAGVAMDKIWIDPGIGFGKTVEHNLSLLKATGEFASSGFPVMIGASRKSFIGTVAGADDPLNRLPGSLAAALYSAQKGARVIRTHDVAATVQALILQEAIMDAD
jgi:dihydropteroate synthase